MLGSSVDSNDYVGRIAIGRVEQGTIRTGQEIALVARNGDLKEKAKATKLFTFAGLHREPMDQAGAGGIVALDGYEKVKMGDPRHDAKEVSTSGHAKVEQPNTRLSHDTNTS